jgi:hypothetical protein
VKEIFTTPNILKIENRKQMNTKFAAEDLQVTFRHLCCWGLHPVVAPATAAEHRTKVQNIFCCSIVNVKLGQKAE